ncbi:MAG TPA: hypothetical protein VMN35_06410 [Gaiellaceae bacterium]|nr:hypothetical protein [Gaiellaceae bacterium]
MSKTYALGEHDVRAVTDVDLVIRPRRVGGGRRPERIGEGHSSSCSAPSTGRARGRILFEGRDIGRLGDGALGELCLGTFGFVLQQLNLIPTLTAAQNVEVALAPNG